MNPTWNITSRGGLQVPGTDYLALTVKMWIKLGLDWFESPGKFQIVPGELWDANLALMLCQMDTMVSRLAQQKRTDSAVAEVCCIA